MPSNLRPAARFPLPSGSVAPFRLFAGVGGAILSEVVVCRVVEVGFGGDASAALVEPVDPAHAFRLEGDTFEVDSTCFTLRAWAVAGVSFARSLRPGRATRARLFRLCSR